LRRTETRCVEGRQAQVWATHVIIRAKIPHGSSDHFCSMGTENATVLPVPVREPPMQSRPLRISGIQALWMPVGRLISIEESDATSHGATSIVAKLTFSLVFATSGAVLGVGWMPSRPFAGLTRDNDGKVGCRGAVSTSESDPSSDSFLLFLELACASCMSSSDSRELE